MKKILLLLNILLLLTACGIAYDGETKLVLQGKIVDRAGNPIPNKKVTINLCKENSCDDISYGNTDSNGTFLLIFPSPFQILI